MTFICHDNLMPAQTNSAIFGISGNNPLGTKARLELKKGLARRHVDDSRFSPTVSVHSHFKIATVIRAQFSWLV